MDNGEKQKKFIELRAKGVSYNRIAGELGVSKTTLVKWSKEFVNEIGNLRSIEYEGLCQEYQAGREHRVKVLGTHLSQIAAEILKRDLSTVPTWRLFLLEARICEQLREDAEDVTFTQQKPFAASVSKLMSKPETWKG